MGIQVNMRLFIAVTTVCLSLGSRAAMALNEQTEAWQKVDDHRRLSVSDDIRYEDGNNGFTITEGAALILPSSDFQVNTPLSKVQAKGNSLIFVRVHGGAVHAFVLMGNATLKVGDKSFPIVDGEEAMVSDHKPYINQELMQADKIARRRLMQNDLGNGGYVGLAEFSLMQAAQHEPLIHHLVYSRDSHDKSLRDRVIKTAAVLNVVTARHGGYMAP
jgi:hypothetical protein